MSEMAKAYAAFKRHLCVGDSHLVLAKAAFKVGWEAREILANKRVSEIEKAATLKERERCAEKAENYSAALADEIRRG
jgi:hypothetical protein